MFIAKVIGIAISTIKVEKIENTKLKVVELIDPYGKSQSECLLVEDGIGVGVGEKVLISDDDEAVSKIVGRQKVPIQWSIIAKVDRINMVDDK